MKEIVNDDLAKIINDEKKSVVLYGASWCGVCKIVKPKIEALSKEYDDINFYYVDAEKNVNSRSLAEVNNLPTFASFSHGKLIKQGMGSQEAAIKGVIDAVAGN